MKRLDQRLVDEGLAPTRSKAQQLIEEGEGEVQAGSEWQVATRPAQKTSALVRLKSEAQTLKYVSRGGLKLEAALRHLQLSVEGWRCLDAGQSTGGFTDALLQAGARKVIGFDVGHDQLALKLRNDPRVRFFEGIHIRDLSSHHELASLIAEGIELCVADLSFISFTHALAPLQNVLTEGCRLLALIKPQFEAGPQALNSRGVLADPTLLDESTKPVLQALPKYGFSVIDHFPSAVKGQDGNQEFFVYAHRCI